jgi:DNA (cytosine-5)-methyltransferase 1
MTQRKLSANPDIDLYVCGFPCQPFSLAGKREGTRDARGTIFWECLRVIRYKKPMIFILENVRGLLSIDGGETFRTIMTELQKIRAYNVRWKILNTADYGIPQSRKRVFIVGLLKKYEKIPFQWPEAIPCRPLSEFVDNDGTPRKSTCYTVEKALQTVTPNAIFIDLSFISGSRLSTSYVAPCLNTIANLWCVPKSRYATIKEYLTLQGFPTGFKLNVSQRQMKRQVGNSISVNVLYSILKMVVKCLS